MPVYKLTWMPDVLLTAGLKVAECDGWRERGRAEMGTVRGVMCHHTGNPQPGNMPTLEVLKKGRKDLRGPLCNLGLGRDGTFYIVAAGKANHAGPGRWEGIALGNSSFIGIEAEHSGSRDDPWPEVQLEAYQRGVAALLRHIGAGANMVCGHKEYALPEGRKIDPTFDMPGFRLAVSDYIAGKSPPDPIEATDAKQRPTLRRGDRGAAVEDLQDLLLIGSDGVFGPRTEAAVREWQRRHGLVADGIFGPKSWAVSQGEAEPPRPAVSAAPSSPPPLPEHGWTISPRGVALIHEFEACHDKRPDGRFQAYPDPGSKNGLPWTIGWGSTGSDIIEGTVFTQEQCDERFVRDIQRYVDQVARAIGEAPTTQNQFDAMVSFHYNTGAIARATLTRRHKAGNFNGAAEAFGMWIKNDGKVMRGLVRRRKAEADLYLTPQTPATAVGRRAA